MEPLLLATADINTHTSGMSKIWKERALEKDTEWLKVDYTWILIDRVVGLSLSLALDDLPVQEHHFGKARQLSYQHEQANYVGGLHKSPKYMYATVPAPVCIEGIFHPTDYVGVKADDTMSVSINGQYDGTTEYINSYQVTKRYSIHAFLYD